MSPSRCLFAAAMGAVLVGVGRKDDDATRDALDVNVGAAGLRRSQKRIGGLHLRGEMHFDQLGADVFADLVDLPRNELTERDALDDAGQRLQNPNTHVAAILPKLGTP